MNTLIRSEDAPTHKLVLKLEDGTYRTFYITEKEAHWLTQNINSVEPNILLPKSIDPNYPSFYPKRGAWMERLTAEERIERNRRYVTQVRQEVDAEAQEMAKAARTKAIRAWRDAHPQEFERMQQEAEERLRNGKGMFHLASKGVKKSLVHYETLRAVDEMLLETPQSPS